MSEPNVKRRWESFLPDEIVINILSRLHPIYVLRCRCVYKKWRDLTSTSDFVDLHKQRCIGHMILVDVPGRKWDQRDRYFLDKWWFTGRKKPPIRKIYGRPLPLHHTEYSQDGLLVMSSECISCQEFIIVNPIFREEVKIVVSDEWHSRISKVYGVFFNPTLKEYCALFDVALRSSAVKPPITFKMLTLGPKPYLRDIRNPFKDRRISSDFEIKPPVMVDGLLYWMINVEEKYSCYADIMEFDTRSDEFKLIRCPAQMTNDYSGFGLDLLNIHGYLSLVQIAANQEVVEVNMWTLEDRASESWSCSHCFVDYKVYPREAGWMHFETIAVRRGEIVIRSDQKLYVCNLGWGTAKVLGSRIYNDDAKFFSHDISLSSLKNCKPVIHIGNRKKCRDCDRLDRMETSTSNSTVNEHSDVVEEITLDAGAGFSAHVDGEPNTKGMWESFLPDEIIINILRRLEAKDVLKCRCVLKRWRDLTSTSHFMDLHKQLGVVQMIFVDLPKRKKGERDQFFLDRWWITAGKKQPIQKIYSQLLYSSEFSQNGFLVMSSRCMCSHEFIIVNPIFRDKVKIVISKEWHSWISKVYGVFFNPNLKEYCALLEVTLHSSVIGQDGTMKRPITCKMLTLGPKPCLRDIRNPYNDRYPSPDLTFKRPAMVDGYLYWLIDLEEGNEYSDLGDIMEFDTRSDEFKVMRCPAQSNDEYGRFGLDLLNVDGFLTLVQLAEHQGAVVVNMCKLKDRASELWACSRHYLSHRVYPPERDWEHLETIAVRCGEILIRSEEILYVCNLKSGTAKVLGNKIYKGFVEFFSHDISLSSLKNCKPVIRIGYGMKCQDCIRSDMKKTSSSNSAMYEQSEVVEETTISGLDVGVGSSTRWINDNSLSFGLWF